MNTRPPPPQGAPPSYTFVTRFYRSSLRPVVMATSLLTAVWALFQGIGFYRNVGPYNDNDAPVLAKFSIIVGSLYMGVLLIGLFGIGAAASQKLHPIRIFAYLSALGALIVAGLTLFLVIIHFTMRTTILDACTNAATGQTFVYGGWWGPVYSDTLGPDEAKAFCNRYYDRDSWSLIVGFLILTGLGIFFSIIAFSYLRQMLDPASPANIIRDPQRSGFYPAHYNPPFGASAGYAQDYYNYPAPAGPPPSGAYPGPPEPEYDTKPPGYTGDGWEDMQKKGRDEEGGPSERDVASPKTGAY